MRNAIITVIIILAATNIYSQQNNLIDNNCTNIGLNITSDSEVINSENLLNKYLDMPIYKIYLKTDGNEVVEFGPSKADLTKIFGNKNGDKGYYCLNNLAGLNFAAIQALNEKTNNLQNTMMNLEAMQASVANATADFIELQNQMIELTGTIDELKQKNSELENTINDLRVEMKTKE